MRRLFSLSLALFLCAAIPLQGQAAFKSFAEKQGFNRKGSYTPAAAQKYALIADGSKYMIGTTGTSVVGQLAALYNAKGIATEVFSGAYAETGNAEPTIAQLDTHATTTVDTFTADAADTKHILIVGAAVTDAINAPTTSVAALQTYLTNRISAQAPGYYDEIIVLGVPPFWTSVIGQATNRIAFTNTRMKPVYDDFAALGVTRFDDLYQYSELNNQADTTYFTTTDTFTTAGKGVVARSILDNIESGGIILLDPDPYSVWQRKTFDGAITSTGPIMVRGFAYGPGKQILQGRFGSSNAWTDVTTQSGGQLLLGNNEAFAGYVNNQVVTYDNGRQTFQTKWQNNGNARSGSASIANVGLGDVYLVGGQSNAVTRTDDVEAFVPVRSLPSDYVSFYAPNTVITSSTGPGGTSVYPFTIGAYTWRDFNGGGGQDFWWVNAVNPVVSYTGLPVGLVRLACSGVAIDQWQETRALSDLTDLNSNARQRNIDTGGGGLMLFHQGEADAGFSQAAYETALGTFLPTWQATALTDTGRNTVMMQNTLSEGVTHTYTQSGGNIVIGSGNPSTNPSNAIRNRWPSGANPLTGYYTGADLNNSLSAYYVKLPDDNGQSGAPFAYTGTLGGTGTVTNAQDPIHMKKYNGSATIAGAGVANALLTPAAGDTLPFAVTFFTK